MDTACKIKFKWGSPNTFEQILKYTKTTTVLLNDIYYGKKPTGKDLSF